MILAVDGIAERYSVLPSKVMQEASTFDIYVMNTSIQWRNRQRALREAGVDGMPHLSQDQINTIWTNFKEKK
jgi:hypothetical protein